MSKFHVGDRVRFKHMLLKHENCEGSVKGIRHDKTYPTIIIADMDRGIEWAAREEDWVLIKSNTLWARLKRAFKGKLNV